MKKKVKGSKKTNRYKQSLDYYQRLIDLVGIQRTTKILKDNLEHSREAFYEEIINLVYAYIKRQYNVSKYPPLSTEEKKNEDTWYSTYVFCHILMHKIEISANKISRIIGKSSVQVRRYAVKYDELKDVPNGFIYKQIRDIYDRTDKYIDKLLEKKLPDF